MMYKIFIVGLLSLLICGTAVSQYNFDSIKICHAKSGELKDISVGEYEVKINGGQLLSLSSIDEAIKYEAGGKLFTIKNLSNGNYLKLQLSNEGVIISTKDTSFLLHSPQSLGLASSNGTNDVQAVYSISHFSFSLEFKNNKVSKIYLPTPGRYIAFSLVQVQGVYTWDFGIESTNHVNKVLLTYVFNKPYLLSIHDDKNKVGVRLLAKKKNGFFSDLVGQRIYENNSFASDASYRLQYTSDGRLKKKTSNFSLVCEE